MFRPRFQQQNLPKGIERSVLDRALPTLERIALLRGRHNVHDVLPGAGAHFGITGGEIRARDVEIESGLHVRFVLRREEATGFEAVLGFKTFLSSA